MTVIPEMISVSGAAERAKEPAKRIGDEAKAGRIKAKRVSQKTTILFSASFDRWVKKGRGRQKMPIGDILDLGFVYRLYGRRDVLLYVGSTSNLRDRLRQHAMVQTWWLQVSYATVEAFPSRRDAYRAESAAITYERPMFNRQNVYLNTARTT